MKTRKYILPLCAAMLLLLAGCGVGTKMLDVSGGEGGYRFVIAAGASDYVAGKVLALAERIYERTGAVIPLVRGYSAETEKEILVGATDRAASASADGLSEYEYLVGERDGKLLIAGGSDYALALAVDFFEENYLGAARLAVPTGDKKMGKYTPIDNSALLPAYVEDGEVSLVSAEPGGRAMTPDWAGGLVMMEVHVETATPEGTFAAAVKVLDHAAQMGVNGIWIDPIYAKGPGGNGYGNLGPHTVEPALTGKSDYGEGRQVVKWFVDEAHKRNIRIFLDIITWGTTAHSDLFLNHPDWYSGKEWDNEGFDWTNPEFREWFTVTVVELIEETGADGLRCDCEPGYTGYDLYGEIRARLLEKGRKILIIAEDGAERRDTYDFEQDGVLSYLGWDRGQQYVNPKNFYIDEFDIVESVQNGVMIGMRELQHQAAGGEYRFYTYCVSNHDFQRTIVDKNRLVLGYQAIFSPFIPLWYFGEEFGIYARNAVIYFLPVDWELLSNGENRAFLEDIKAYLRIRRTYPEIFEYWPENHRDSNICAAETDGALSAYARFAGNRGVIVAPNNNSDGKTSFEVKIPYEAMGLEAAEYIVTDLLTGKELARGGQGELTAFAADIPFEHIGVYLIEAGAGAGE